MAGSSDSFRELPNKAYIFSYFNWSDLLYLGTNELGASNTDCASKPDIDSQHYIAKAIP